MCGSLNQMDAAATQQPTFIFHGDGGRDHRRASGKAAPSRLRYRQAYLPREAGGIDASWAWSAALCDLDLDGALDVFCANGYVTGDTPWDT